MSIFDRIVSKLRDIILGVERKVEEVREHFEERRAASLAERLDELAKDKPYKNWRESIEDLVYLVDEDGSYAGRTELWSISGLKGTYKGSDAQNIALHKWFLAQLPTHGIPWPKVKA